MRIDRAGWPFVLAGLIPAGLLAAFGMPVAAVVFAALAAFMLYFFRDPDRRVPSVAGAIVSPADGRVLVAGEAEAAAAPPGAWKQISIFLSPLDVHINRIPFRGRVTRVEYTPGRFLAAYRPESAKVNERNEVWLDNDDILILFPEGSRGSPEKISKIKKGLFYLARERSDIKITPIAIYGLGRALPRGEALFVPFNCDVIVGDPLPEAESSTVFIENIAQSFAELFTQCLTRHSDELP